MRWIATVGGIGLLPKAPGTWGSAAALPLGYGLHVLGGPLLLVFATLLALVLGWYATKVEIEATGDTDPSHVVIDELVGQFIALWPLSIGLYMANVAPHVFPWPGWVGAFVMFRLFDIWKPGPIGWADRRHTAWGVMLDDVFAGIAAACVVTFAAGLSHGVF